MREPGTPIPKPLNLPCGGLAIWDSESEISYRCTTCFTVVGSMGMPRDCYELMKTEGVQERV